MKKFFLMLICFLLSSSVVSAESKLEQATFAGGCFWCLQAPFDKIEGVVQTDVGYSGGKVENPTYKNVSKGITGHLEVMQVTFDTEKVSYEKILDTFWRNIDPFDAGGQFCDRGQQYSTAIFYHNETQKELAEKSKQKISKSKKKVVTPIIPMEKYYSAEGYHQKYYKKNPLRYKMYRLGCGRDSKLKKIWGK